MSACRRRMRPDDRGLVPQAEMPFGVLLIAATALMVLTFPTWENRHEAARAAADEAARAVVVANTWEQGTADAGAVVEEVAANHGLEPGELDLEIDGSWERGADVTARVRVVVPATELPLVGPVGSFTLTVAHTETIDQYRSLG